jgi:hypothetical protein
MCFYALPPDEADVMTVSLAGKPMVRVHRVPCGQVAAGVAQGATTAVSQAVTGAIRKRFPLVGALLDGVQGLRRAHAASHRRST